MVALLFLTGGLFDLFFLRRPLLLRGTKNRALLLVRGARSAFAMSVFSSWNGPASF